MNKLSVAILALGLVSGSFGQALYTSGHGDIGIGFGTGGWDMHIHSDQHGESEAGDQIVVAPLSSLVARNASSAYNFTGVGAGETYFRLPSSGSTAAFINAPFLGISAEEFDGPAVSYAESNANLESFVGISNPVAEWISLELVSVNAPSGGVFSVYSELSGGPIVWMSTFDGVNTSADKFILPKGFHEHVNWGFSKAGTYEVTFRGKFWDGSAFQTSPDTTYTFQAVPEPASMAALGLGIVGLLRRRAKKSA